MNRRSFMEKAGLRTAGLSSLAAAAEVSAHPLPKRARGEETEPDRYGIQRVVTEWAYTSRKSYADPYNEVQLDVIFTDPEGKEYRMPAFWAGEKV